MSLHDFENNQLMVLYHGSSLQVDEAKEKNLLFANAC
jgi:hypothetical protein